jgi:hypothetical protein
MGKAHLKGARPTAEISARATLSFDLDQRRGDLLPLGAGRFANARN